jgi:hypothetical protein
MRNTKRHVIWHRRFNPLTVNLSASHLETTIYSGLDGLGLAADGRYPITTGNNC